MITIKAPSLQIVLFTIMLLRVTNLEKNSMGSENLPNIIIYTKSYCPYCVKAKRLLNDKNLDYVEIDIEKDDDSRQAMLKKSGGSKTVPQIFINNKHIGGCDDLYVLEEDSKLDEMINLKR
jgi:glutaredoxin 3